MNWKTFVILNVGVIIGLVVAAFVIIVNGQAQAAEVTPTPSTQMVCFLDDDRYVLSLEVDLTPTRMVPPTPTNLPEPTREPSATPAPACIKTGTVTATRLNVRTGPDQTFPVMATGSPLLTGQIVCIVKVQGDWLELRQGGWVNANWVQVAK